MFKRRIGSSCSGSVDSLGFQVAVNLLDYKKVTLQKATAGIFQYIKFMRDAWQQRAAEFEEFKKWIVKERLAEVNRKDPVGYVEFIAEISDDIKNKFSESDLCEPVAQNECKEFITQNILENKNAVYSIVTREAEKVLEKLNIKTSFISWLNAKMETEAIYKTQFKFIPTTIDFNKEEHQVFTNGNMDNCFKENQSNKLATTTLLVEDTKDLAYQYLCAANLNIQNRHFRKSYKILFPGDDEFYAATDCQTFATLQSLVDDDEIKKKLGGMYAFNMNSDQFQIVKKYRLRSLAAQLTDSKQLAKSFLTAAVQNSHCRAEIHPLIQYNTLRGITSQDYTDHFNPNEDTMGESRECGNVIAAPEDFLLQAINKNDLSTVTLHFLKVNDMPETDKQIIDELLKHINNSALTVRRKYGISTLRCYPLSICCNGGVVIETHTVEKRDNHQKVREEIVEELIETIYQSVESNESDEQLMEMVEDMDENKFCIQIYGHNASTVSKEATFEEQFGKWLEENRKILGNFFQMPQTPTEIPEE